MLLIELACNYTRYFCRKDALLAQGLGKDVEARVEDQHIACCSLGSSGIVYRAVSYDDPFGKNTLAAASSSIEEGNQCRILMLCET